MTPIHELLNRIRWDEEFGQAEFEIGYYERLEDRIIRVPLREIFFEPTIILHSTCMATRVSCTVFHCTVSNRSSGTGS